jgi:intracellular sulfur oxidation DsrE/DsrF family protein
MQIKQSIRTKRLLVVINVLAINVAVASPASDNIVSVINEKGDHVTIEKSSIRLTPVYKGALFAELKNKEANYQSAKLQFQACGKSMDKFYCLKMYGDDVLEKKQKVPGTIPQIAFDPLYVIVAYKPVVTDSINQRRFGEDALVICLNPNIPSGYWSAINQWKPILKSTPSTTDNQQPLERLKFKACKHFVRF